MTAGRLTLLFLAVLGLYSGCSRPGRLPTAPVRGSVKLDGSPVTAGMIIFLPQRGRAAQGEIRPDGSFILGTYGVSDGAIVGTHRVAIVGHDGGPPSEADAVAGKKANWNVPQRYTAPETSGLVIEVLGGVSNECDINLHSP